ncbi:putative Voltage-dependent T-type calcium channel subunit alpha-1I [Daphnia magna]|uniref:Putative Voltage-dependent T-type calcium channel subunit alpha-1I n=1 Tax=Daphnia magna TaxID=35525 RepID=A0A164X2I8_9CRUS|nr:putative Voltage-dependent T-type calcium channel subunit alpha-1I [Daphnia magna]
MHTCASLPHTKSDGRVCNDSVVPGIPVGMDGLSVNGSCINWNQYYTDCRAGEKNPFQGAISFDNIGLAWVAIFLVISLEGWTDIMYYVQDAHSFWDWVYFVLLIVIGSFFMINLCLVVIATQFSETKKREMERMRLERARYQSTSTLASTSASESTSCYRQIIKYIAHLWRRSKRRILRRYRAYRSRKKLQQQQQQLDHPQYGKQQSATHSLSLRTRRKQQRRRKRRRRRSRHPHPECPKHGAQQQEQQQQHQLQRNSQCSSSYRVPSVSSQVALRINDGPASPLDSPVPILSNARRASVAVSIDHHHQRSSPFLSPRGSLAMADDSSDSSQLLTPRTPRRRRSSVMFSDVVVAHGMSNSAADVNVCWSEKITQTGGFTTESVASAGSESRQPHHQTSGSSNPSSPLSFNRKSSLRQRVTPNQTTDELRPSCSALGPGSGTTSGSVAATSTLTQVPNGAGLTCQELLALSGALGAALPTPLALPNYPSDEPKTAVMVVAPVAAKHSNNHKCNNQLLAPPGMMPILPTLAMSLWPEPFQDPGRSGDDHWTTIPCVNNRKPAETAETAVDVETDNEDDRNCICCSSDDEEYSASDEEAGSEDQNEDYYEEDEEQRGASVEVFEHRRSPLSRYWSLVKEYYKTFQRSVKALVEHKYFQQGLLGAILINTLSMGIEYHNQPEELTLTVEFSNIVFSAIFAIEMLLKVIAEGPLNYIGNGFNVFDGVIVILSLVEVFQSLNRFEGDDGGSSGLSVLRTFRLLRILKLVRFMPNLRRQLIVMLRTMDNVAVFFALLLLFIFIFRRPPDGCRLSRHFIHKLALQERKDRRAVPVHSVRSKWEAPLSHNECTQVFDDIGTGWMIFDGVNSRAIYVGVFFYVLFLFIFILLLHFSSDGDSILGMNLFGCKFCRKTSDQSTSCDRKNFDSLLWAIVTVFQILTQEDWNVVLFNGMEKTSHWAALYFVALMTFGNYVLFNLLVAILVEGFSAERTERLEREQREQARQERHAARALATAAALSIQDEATSGGSCHGDQETGPPAPENCSPDSPSSADGVGCHQQELQHDNYFSRSSVTEESCSPVGYCANDIAVEDVLVSVVDSAQLADLLLEVRVFGTVVALNDVVIDGTDPGPKPRAVRTEMRRPPYYTNYSRSRLVIHNVVTSKYVDLAIAAVIGLNVVTMAMEFYLMPPELESALRIFNYFFTAVFIIESVCKVVALGVRRYIKDRWNQLDVAIVILSIVGIVLEEMKSDLIPINPTIIRVMRVLRIARVLKLLKMAKGIRSLLDTVMQALPQVGNLGLLFYLLFFIFAALGVELFGRLECDDDHPCQGLGEHAHFANFGIAFLTLFRVATGDNWNGIMKDTLRENCDPSADCIRNCCVSRIIAPIFFVIFVLMAQFVLVNVVVAVLMKHLEESHKQMEDDMEMEMELAEEFAPLPTANDETVKVNDELEELELTNTAAS